VEAPVRAAEYFADGPDLLIMNGDIPTTSQTHEDIRSIFDITSAVAHGEIPVVFARGNHDYRGRYATDLPQYIGNNNVYTWFTFRLGSLWGLVLDCGEDKEDGSCEYGGLVDCHTMRLKETEFLENVVRNAETEYRAPGVRNRIVVTHMPFCASCVHGGNEKFNIEVPLFTYWTELVNSIAPDVMLCGHMHFLRAALPGTEEIRMDGQFPVVICSEPCYGEEHKCKRPEHAGAQYIGMAMVVDEGKIVCTATSDIGTEEELWRMR